MSTTDHHNLTLHDIDEQQKSTDGFEIEPTKRTRPLILIADDDRDIRELLKTYFEPKDCDLIESRDGEDTLEKVIQFRPELVILDVMMPEFSGWEVCKYIKTREAFQHTGVIMLTGIGALNNELNSPLFGADDYVDKPFEFSELEFKVRRVLSKKKRT